ncbi:hypothetical protein RFE81_000624 [Klebsiella pneumoniae]
MVENDTSSVEYQLSTSTGPFSIPFYFIENGHIVAELYTQNGDDFNKTTLTIDVDYYLNGAGDKNGGQLTLLSAHSGATLLIYRDPDATQLTSYLATGKFPATSHERALDKLTMLIQKFGWWWDSLALKKPNIFANYYDALNNRIRNLRDPSLAQDAATKSYVDSSDIDLQQQITSNFNRSLRVPDSYISQLPSAQDRAWKGLGFDGAGQPKLQDPAGTGLWGYVPAIGSFEQGSLLTQRFEVLLWESTDEYWRWDGAMPKIVLPGSTPATAGGTGKGKWIDVTDATLRQNLASEEEEEGDALLAVKQPFDGAVSRTQHDKNAEFVSITDFSGALSGRENDSTSAFVAAYTLGLPVYVPYGDWFTSDYRPEKLFGPGVIYSDDSYFTDSGERPQHGAIQTGKSINEHSETWGNRERAVGRSLIVNNPNGRVQVSGFSSPSQYASYINSDHVGYYIGMYGPKNQTLTTAASTTYTSDSLTAPEIVESNDIRLGMFVKTKHSTPYKGKIIGVDYDSNTVTVDGWYAQGNTASGQVPDSGKAALINAADKMWGQNTVVFLEPDSTAVTATGYELGFQLDTAPGNPVWGYHAVNYSDTYYLNHAFRATGRWNIAFYATSQALVGLQHDVGEGNQTAVLVSNLTDQNWTGSAVNLNTNFRKSTSSLATVRTGGVTHFNIDSRGSRSVQRESVAVISSGTTVTGLSPSIILCNGAADFVVNLSASNAVAGQVIEFRNVGAGVVSVGGASINTMQYAKFVFDGSTFILLFKA